MLMHLYKKLRIQKGHVQLIRTTKSVVIRIRNFGLISKNIDLYTLPFSLRKPNNISRDWILKDENCH